MANTKPCAWCGGIMDYNENTGLWKCRDCNNTEYTPIGKTEESTKLNIEE